VRRELNSAEVERLFVGALDGALPDGDEAELKTRLDDDPELKAQFAQYERAVKLLRGQPREKAPEALSSLILRRTRRRRGALRSAAHAQLHYRVPAEVLIPLLIAVLVALFMIVSIH